MKILVVFDDDHEASEYLMLYPRAYGALKEFFNWMRAVVDSDEARPTFEEIHKALIDECEGELMLRL